MILRQFASFEWYGEKELLSFGRRMALGMADEDSVTAAGSMQSIE